VFGLMGTKRYLAPDPDDPMALPDLLRQAADVTQQHLLAVCRSWDGDRVRHAHATDGRAVTLAATGAGGEVAEMMDSALTELVGEWVDDGVGLRRLGHDLALVGVDSGRHRSRGR
jgi:hypothetical protein